MVEQRLGSAFRAAVGALKAAGSWHYGVQRGDLLTLLPAGKDGNGYQITPDLVLNRRPGRKQWSYSIDCKEIECHLKARQSYEQQSGVVSYSVGAAFWEVRASKG
jgi:hypothetical protein